jgi:hypothetical protein
LFSLGPFLADPDGGSNCAVLLLCVLQHSDEPKTVCFFFFLFSYIDSIGTAGTISHEADHKIQGLDVIRLHLSLFFLFFFSFKHNKSIPCCCTFSFYLKRKVDFFSTAQDIYNQARAN